MPIIPNLNIIFIHIPKTGGSSINEFFKLSNIRDKHSIVGNFLCENKLPGVIYGEYGKPFVYSSQDLRKYINKGDFIRIGDFLYQIHSEKPLLPKKIHLACIDNAKSIMQGNIAKQSAIYFGKTSKPMLIHKKLVSDTSSKKIIPSKFHWGWITTHTKNGKNLIQIFENSKKQSGKPAIELDHVSILYIKSRIPNNIYNNMFKFCVVRNPYSRLVSEYFWKIKDDDIRFDIDCKRLSFTQFIKVLNLKFPKLLKQPHAEVSHYLPQYMFICDKDNNLLVDYVAKLENGLEFALKNVFQKIGLKTTKPIKLVKSNTTKTRRKHYSEYYTPETQNIVYNLYKRDFEIFGYSREL